MQENKQDFSIIKKRILLYINYKGITMYKCYAQTGISRGVLAQPNGISEDNLLKFISTYQDISIIWLMTGKGEMINSKNQIEAEKQEKKQNELQIIEVTPNFILKRFEELVLENNFLKEKLKLYDQNSRGEYSLQDVPALKVAEE